MGLTPDMIVCRAPEELSAAIKQKISIFCHVPTANIVSNYDVSNIYHVPLLLEQQGLHRIVKKHLHLDHMYDVPDLFTWRGMARVADELSEKVTIALVGKYVSSPDSYLSLVVALRHCAIHLKADINVVMIEATDLEDSVKFNDTKKYEAAWETVRSARGILIAGGFGVRGIQGKVNAAKYARENKVPCLGICLGLQVMVIEYARHVLNWEDANSAEFDESSRNPVVIFMPEINQHEMGGTMRLGVRGTTIVQHLPSSASTETTTASSPTEKKLSLAGRVYGINGLFPAPADDGEEYAAVVLERHRHRYEVNPERVDAIEAAGLLFTGRDDQGVRMEIAELPSDVHPFYFGVQFHPEVKSRPMRPSPPLFAFCAASAGRYEILSHAGQLWQEHEESLRQEIVKLARTQPAGSLLTPTHQSSANRLLTRKRSASEAYHQSSNTSGFAAISSPTRGNAAVDISTPDSKRGKLTVEI